MRHKYIELNNSFKKRKFVYHFGINFGFYSEFNNMVILMLYCLQHKINFSQYSKDAKFSSSGLNDFFIPFCDESKFCFHKFLNRRDFGQYERFSRFRFLAIAIYKLFINRYITADFFGEVRSNYFQSLYFDIPELEIKGNLKTACGKLVDIIYDFNKDILSDITKRIESLMLPEKFVFIHVRAGDKIMEANIYSYRNYMSKVIDNSSIKNVFVLTDDFDVLVNLHKDYPDFRFFSLVSELEKGYDNNAFKNESNDMKFNMLVNLFTSLEIAKKSELCVCTYSSNPGMFLGMVMDENKIIGVDRESWIIL